MTRLEEENVKKGEEKVSVKGRNEANGGRERKNDASTKRLT